MPQFKEIPRPVGAVAVRLELSPEDAGALRTLGAPDGLPLSAIARLAMSLLARGEAVTGQGVLREAQRIRQAYQGGAPAPPPDPAPKRGRGRPKKEA